MASKKQIGITPQITMGVDQQAAFKLAKNNAHKFHLFYGPAGSGKSYFILYMIFLRALRTPNSRHAVFRLTRNSCETTLFDKTLQEVFEKSFPGFKDQCQISLSDMTVRFPNGALIQFDGLDENRITKVLGNEFNTIWVNECNEDGFTYKTVSTLLGRLRLKTPTIDGPILKNKMFFDCNPRFFSDWEYRAFKLHVNPEDGDAMPNPEQWVSIKLNTIHNQANLADDYIEDLSAGSRASRQRYLEGEWCDENSNALFRDSMFRDHRIPKPLVVERNNSRQQLPQETRRSIEEHDKGASLTRITVSVDPAVTADPKSDLSGITVQGLGNNGHVYVLQDLSMRASPDAVCKAVVEAYRAWGASRVVMENNQGGLWLEATLRKHFPNVPLKFVNANSTTGGKASRAEPVSAQYERGIVHHVGTLKELEEQMCEFGSPASRRKSPDRMDAVVWGITELLDLNQEQSRPKGVFKVATPGLW